jgi:hypothetical protein
VASLGSSGPDDLDFGIKVTAEGQQIAKQVANDIAGLRITLASLYQLQDEHYRKESARRSADAAASRAAKQATSDAKAQAAAQREATKAANDHANAIEGLGKKLLAAAAAFAAFQGFRIFISEGLKFNATIETANLGIASLITAQAELRDSQGNLLTGTAKLAGAQKLATDQVNKLRIAGLQTTATTQELVIAFQQAVGVGLRWGLTLDQTRKIAIQMSQAAGALGLPMNQLNEEIRDFLGGNISARNTRIATALGITNEQVREAQKTGKLFDFVTGKLEAFSVAGEATAKTFQGVMSNVVEAAQNFAGDATAPLFEQLKIAGQSALEQVFDLKNARISDNFRGILDVSREVTSAIGAQFAAAIATTMEGLSNISVWLVENKGHVDGILVSVGLINHEITALLTDVIRLVIPLGEAGVKADFFKNVLIGVGGVIATIREAFQILTSTLGLIGNLVLSVLIAPFVGWLKIIARTVSLFDDDLAKSIDDVATSGEEFLNNNIEGLARYNEQLLNGGLALDEYAQRLKLVDALQKAAAHSGAAAANAVPGAGGITLKSTAGGAKPTNPAKGAAGERLLAKAELDAQLKDLKIALDNQLISYAVYYDKVAAAQQASIDKQIAAQRRVLEFTTDTGTKDKILSTIAALETERAQVVQDAAEKRRKAELELDEEIVKARVQLLKDEGRLTEARALEVEQKYKTLIATLKANGRTAGAEIVGQLFDIETAKVKMEELTKQSKIITDQLSLDLAGISQRHKAGTLSEQAVVKATTDAYQKAKDALQALIPEMERAASITKDPEQLAAVEQLKQKIADMGATIRNSSDSFLKLREAGRDALQTGLTDFLDEATEGAKSFHDIWLDVARGVVGSLRRIASQMLANLIIQRALGFLGSLGGSVSGAASASGVDLVGDFGVAEFASGGPVSGPGSGTSDSIPSWLSNGEFVVKAAAVQKVGVDFLNAINGSDAPNSVRRHRSRGYAEGGLVSNARGAEPGGFAATIGLEEGLVARHIQSKAGTRAVINVIANNRKTVRGTLGPG